MAVFSILRELRNGERYATCKHKSITETTNTENDDFRNAHKRNSNSEFELRILMQDAVDGQVKNYIAFLNKWLEDLTGLVQRMTQAHPLNLPPMVSTSAKFAGTGTSSDAW